MMRVVIAGIAFVAFALPALASEKTVYDHRFGQWSLTKTTGEESYENATALQLWTARDEFTIRYAEKYVYVTFTPANCGAGDNGESTDHDEMESFGSFYRVPVRRWFATPSATLAARLIADFNHWQAQARFSCPPRTGVRRFDQAGLKPALAKFAQLNGRPAR